MNTASTQTPALTNVESVCPALAHLTQSALLDGVWKRPGLSMRDRSLVTLAALVSLDQTRELPYYVNHALDNGLKPGEISEALVQLAFYSGWENAVDAAVVIQSVFAARGIKTDQLAAVSPKLLALDEAGEAKRASNVSQQFDAVSPGVVQNTTDLLFRDLWLRPGLAPRDRSLVTVASLIATGRPWQCRITSIVRWTTASPTPKPLPQAVTVSPKLPSSSPSPPWSTTTPPARSLLQPSVRFRASWSLIPAVSPEVKTSAFWP